MKIRLQSGDIKLVEELDQLTANTRAYVGQGKASLADAITAPHGVPAGNSFSVDASYDSRPVNCIDFTGYASVNQVEVGNGIYYFSTTLESSNPAFPSSTIDNTTVVPAGYVFILRKIWNLTLGSYVLAYGTLTVLSNNSALKGGEFNLAGDGDINTFLVFDEGQKLSFNLFAAIDYVSANAGGFRSTYYINTALNFYGQFLEKGDAPAQFSYANRVSVNKTANIAGKINE